MSPVGVIAVGLLAVAGVGLLWWLLVTTEGVYLGRRVVIGLYDLYAARYDRIKKFHPHYEHWLLAAPLLVRVAGALPEVVFPVEFDGESGVLVAPLVLDVATGTGRLPLALLETDQFAGRVIGVDLSWRMLAQARDKLAFEPTRANLLQCAGDALPFPDDFFDAVICLEALEFMPDPTAALAELVRVLRPGGVLLVSNRVRMRWMPGKIWTPSALCEKLEGLGIAAVEIEPWQVDYQRVWGIKAEK
jgi:SAM-dependent methyltransferase